MKAFWFCEAGICAATLFLAGCGGGSRPPGLPAAPYLRPLNGSPTFHEFSIPRRPRFTGQIAPIGIAASVDGTLWFAERGDARLGHIDTSGAFMPPVVLRGRGRFPVQVTVDSQGHPWATAGSTHTIKQMQNGVPERFGAVYGGDPEEKPFPAFGLQNFSDPRQDVVGPDGALWFVETRGYIGRLTREGKLEECAIINGKKAFPISIAVGPDDAIWFGELNANMLGRLSRHTPMQAGWCRAHFYAVPSPGFVIAGPDGHLWATEFKIGKLAEICAPAKQFNSSCARGQILQEWQIGAYPKGMTFGGDGNLYIAGFGSGKITEFELAHQKVISIDIPTRKSGPWSMTTDADGNVWFTESEKDKIGELVIMPSR